MKIRYRFAQERMDKWMKAVEIFKKRYSPRHALLLSHFAVDLGETEEISSAELEAWLRRALWLADVRPTMKLLRPNAPEWPKILSEPDPRGSEGKHD